MVIYKLQFLRRIALILTLSSCTLIHQSKTRSASDLASARPFSENLVSKGGIAAGAYRITVSLQSSPLSLINADTVKDLEIVTACESAAPSPTEQGVITIQPDEFFTPTGESTGCKVKLVGFKRGGLAFHPLFRANFNTYAVDEKAIFVHDGQELALQVMQQLPSPLTGNDVVVYQLSELTKDADAIGEVDINITNNQAIIVGDKAPDLSPSDAKLDMKDRGDLKLLITLHCEEEMSTDDKMGSKCGTDEIEDHEIILTVSDNSQITGALLDKLFLSHKQSLATLLTSSPTGSKDLQLALPMAALGSNNPTLLLGKLLLFAIRKSGSTSYRYSFIALQKNDDNLHACWLMTKSGQVQKIDSKESFSDKSRPRFASANEATCNIVGYTSYACMDGKLFGPMFADGTVGACTSK